MNKPLAITCKRCDGAGQIGPIHVHKADGKHEWIARHTTGEDDARRRLLRGAHGGDGRAAAGWGQG